MQTPTRMPLRNLAAAVVGNALEWYDFLVFAFMTPIIARLFFPAEPGTPHGDINAILMTTAVFGVGFFMRPVGGIVLGMFGDRRGRKAALVLVTGLMALSMLLITVAPTYAAAGIVAPLMILAARLVQGFSAGGEFGTSTALLIEMAPRGQRGYYGSWQMASQMVGLLLGAAAGSLTTMLFTPQQIEAWAWRIPFVIGLVIIPAALYIRRHLDETEAFEHLQHARHEQPHVQPRAGFADVVTHYGRETLIGIGLVMTATVSIYITFTYLVTYATKILNLSLQGAFQVQLASAVLMVILTPLMGKLSDRIGRSPILIVSLVAYLIILYPLQAWLVGAPSIGRLMLVQALLSIPVSGFFAVFSPIMASLFPTRIRAFGLSIAYNVSVMIFGGFAQFFVTWLFKITQSPLSSTYYVLVGVVVGLLAALALGRRANEDHAE